MIQQKPIHATPPHLQDMLLHMQKYDYTIQYKPCKEMILADHLSHFLSLKKSLPIAIHQNLQHFQLSNDRLDAIRGAVECNPVYNTLCCLTLRGCLNCLKQVPRIAQHFSGTPDELAIEAGILLKGHQIHIPSKLLNRTLNDLHSAHQGMEKM